MIARCYVRSLHMSNQGCPAVPIVAIDKVGVLSISGGYGTSDMFLGHWVNAVRWRTCQGCAFAW